MKRAELYDGLEVYISGDHDWQGGCAWRAGPGVILDCGNAWEEKYNAAYRRSTDDEWDYFRYQPTWNGKGNGVLVERMVNEFNYKTGEHELKPRLDVVPLGQIRGTREHCEAIIAQKQEARAKANAESAARAAAARAGFDALVDRFDAAGFTTVHEGHRVDRIVFSLAEAEALLKRLGA